MKEVIYHGIPKSEWPDPVDQITTNLFMGRRPATYFGYELVISCEEFLAKGPMENYSGITIHCPMRDETGFKINRRAVEAAARAALHVINNGGGDVLVHCTGGLNRSGVVAAEILKFMGYTGRDAVDELRLRRDPYVLCNREFERWVTGEQLPTAETWGTHAPRD